MVRPWPQTKMDSVSDVLDMFLVKFENFNWIFEEKGNKFIVLEEIIELE
jgi:hypothetical protein